MNYETANQNITQVEWYETASKISILALLLACSESNNIFQRYELWVNQSRQKQI